MAEGREEFGRRKDGGRKNSGRKDDYTVGRMTEG
jgi:hypothetical protein